MKNKQTAVEWLYSIVKIEHPEFNDSVLWLALNMEKEQIIDAFGVGCQVESTRLIGYQDIAKQYYNETYGKHN